jgi:hypothetical protein
MVRHFLFPNRAGGRMPASHPKHGGSREYMKSQNLMMILIYLPTMSRLADHAVSPWNESNYESAFRRMQ